MDVDISWIFIILTYWYNIPVLEYYCLIDNNRTIRVACLDVRLIVYLIAPGGVEDMGKLIEIVPVSDLRQDAAKVLKLEAR